MPAPGKPDGFYAPKSISPGRIYQVVNQNISGYNVIALSPHMGPVPPRYISQNVCHTNVKITQISNGREIHNFHVAWCRRGGSGCQPAVATQAICLYVSDTAGVRASAARVLLDRCYNNFDMNKMYADVRSTIESSLRTSASILASASRPLIDFVCGTAAAAGLLWRLFTLQPI